VGVPYGVSVAPQRLRSWSTISFERDALVYRISASSNPARDVNGDQSSSDLGGGGVG
jgi:hypothetical protein